MKTQPLPNLLAGLFGLLAAASAQVPAAPPAISPAQPNAPKTEAVAKVTSETEKGLRLNFRGVPLEMVLDYLSEAAGFVIMPHADIRGKVDVWGAEPLTKDEAVMVLNSVLAKNGYAAIRNGRTLTIVGIEEARRKNIPVKRGDDPASIPATEEMLTQIIPVKFINAAQLINNLEQLLPSTSNLSANDGANSLVITDTQANIRRVAEIVKALDTPVSSVSTVKVFTLKYADAKTLSTVLRDVFQSQDQTRGNTTGASPFQQSFRGFGGGGPGGFGGPGAFGGNDSDGGSSRGNGSNAGRAATPRLVTTADEQSNSLLVSAPESQMPLIEDLVKQLDVPVQDVTELRVFTLKNSNPQDMADVVKNLFPDSSGSGQNGGASQSGGGFAGPFVGGFIGAGNATSRGSSGAAGDQSERKLKQGRVNAVPELRTSSLIVSAAPVLMEQIASIIAQLDADPAKQQKVFIIPIENSDPAAIQTILQGLFPSQNGTSRSSSTTSRGTSTGIGSTGNSFNRGTSASSASTTSSGFGGSGVGSTGGSGFGGTGTGGGGRQ
ncbi:MAG: hypothetical protein HY300_13895 [Verrucomicrobia bacterium]|nr:hypothetical protein [Verrucomicrobiota bacterium]